MSKPFGAPNPGKSGNLPRGLLGARVGPTYLPPVQFTPYYHPPLCFPAQTFPITAYPDRMHDFLGRNPNGEMSGTPHPPGSSLNSVPLIPTTALLHADKATAIITTAFHHASLLEAIDFRTAVNPPPVTLRPKQPQILDGANSTSNSPVLEVSFVDRLLFLVLRLWFFRLFLIPVHTNRTFLSALNDASILVKDRLSVCIWSASNYSSVRIGWCSEGSQPTACPPSTSISTQVKGSMTVSRISRGSRSVGAFYFRTTSLHKIRIRCHFMLVPRLRLAGKDRPSI